MTNSRRARRFAVVGAGLSGLACAQALVDQGAHVEVFEKSRGVGGRMATRRLNWVSDDGLDWPLEFDHGCLGFAAHGDGFRLAVVHAVQHGWVRAWQPSLKVGRDQAPQPWSTPCSMWVASPAANRWCKALSQGLSIHFGHQVQAAQRLGQRWRLSFADAAEGASDVEFDGLVIAVPAAQAAPLLAAHRLDWADQASKREMLPCWTLMGMTDAIDLPWQVAQPLTGPLQHLVRQDSKPGRVAPAGRALWVAQASPAWSQSWVDASPQEVQAVLEAAVLAQLPGGHTKRWHLASVHRWRYATAAERAGPDEAPGYWWDPDLLLGACGDHLGATGVEGAWLSGRALGQRVAGEART